MPPSLRLIGFTLIATSLSSCSLFRDLRGGSEAPKVEPPPVVHDRPRSAPLQPGENVIVKAVERVGPSVVRLSLIHI